MIFCRNYLIAIFLLLFGAAASGQETLKPVLVDEFGNIHCEDLVRRLDLLAYEATKNPNSVGFVVLYPGKNVFESSAYERAIRRNSVFRRFPDGLIRVIRTTSGENLQIELWRTPADKPLEIRDVPFDYRLSNISRRTLFVNDSAEVFRSDGKLDYGSDGCLGAFNLDVLSKVLEANPALSSEITIFNESSREARKLARLISHAAASENNISKQRLRVKYGGAGKAKDWSSSMSAIEVWLIPTKIK